MPHSPATDPHHRHRYAQEGDELLLPFMESSAIVHMGLNRLPAERWIPACAHLPHYLHNKLRCRRQLGERVYASEPRSGPAQAELHRLLLGHLRRDHGGTYSAGPGCLHWRHGGAALSWPLAAAGEPLWCASQWVADDLCILQPGPHGYALTAASLAAPSYWRLEDKIGRPLGAIHAPVPGFATRIGARVERFFEHLLPDFPVWRSNWSLVDSAELLQRGPQAGNDGELYLRVERQSLRRLPRTGAVVFSIRVMINPLDDLAGRADALAALQGAIDAMSPEEGRYKSLAPLLPRLREYLSAAGVPAGASAGLSGS